MPLLPRFAAINPSYLDVFHFGKGKERYCKNEGNDSFDKFFENDKRAKRIAKRFVVTLDRSIGYLGPDYELLTDVLQVLGQKHKKYGVTSEYFKQMGNALIETLEDVLGNENNNATNNKFPHDVKQSWIEVYQLFSGEMLNA